MKSALWKVVFFGGFAALLAVFGGCQHGPFQRGAGENIATIVNQTQYTLEVQENGEFVTSIGTGETHNIRHRSRGSDGPVTALVMAYNDDGRYAGAAYRTFRPRGFLIWEIESGTLRKGDIDK